VKDYGMSTWKEVKRCYETHPALDIGPAKIYGGSCAFPVIKDADVYVGFDASMPRTDRQYPWSQSTEFLYRINDMEAPKDLGSFNKLLDFLAEAIASGKKVHCGCIGGHGRTGTVLAALVSVITGEKDAITYVRDNYCKKAVESVAQIEFLHKNYGIVRVDSTKGAFTGMSNVAPIPTYREFASRWESKPIVAHSGKTYSATPAKNDKVCVWGKNAVFDKLSIYDTITV